LIQLLKLTIIQSITYLMMNIMKKKICIADIEKQI